MQCSISLVLKSWANFGIVCWFYRKYKTASTSNLKKQYEMLICIAILILYTNLRVFGSGKEIVAILWGFFTDYWIHYVIHVLSISSQRRQVCWSMTWLQKSGSKFLIFLYYKQVDFLFLANNFSILRQTEMPSVMFVVSWLTALQQHCVENVTSRKFWRNRWWNCNYTQRFRCHFKLKFQAKF